MLLKRVIFLKVHVYGIDRAESKRLPFEECREFLGDQLFEQVKDELELIEMAGDPYDHEKFLAGECSPVFWGSAMNNFGVEPLLEFFLADKTASPKSRTTIEGNKDYTFTK